MPSTQRLSNNGNEISTSSQKKSLSTPSISFTIQEPEYKKDWGDTNSGYHEITEDYPETDGNSEDEDKPEYDLNDLYNLSNYQPTSHTRRKSISLCRHKLQGRTGC